MKAAGRPVAKAPQVHRSAQGRRTGRQQPGQRGTGEFVGDKHGKESGKEEIMERGAPETAFKILLIHSSTECRVLHKSAPLIPPPTGYSGFLLGPAHPLCPFCILLKSFFFFWSGTFASSPLPMEPSPDAFIWYLQSGYSLLFPPLSLRLPNTFSCLNPCTYFSCSACPPQLF